MNHSTPSRQMFRKKESNGKGLGSTEWLLRKCGVWLLRKFHCTFTYTIVNEQTKVDPIR